MKYQFNLPHAGVLYMAGLYQNFGDKRCYVIITTAANESMVQVHNRMPVVLQRKELDTWLVDDGEGAVRILQAERPKLIKQTVE